MLGRLLATPARLILAGHVFVDAVRLELERQRREKARREHLDALMYGEDD